jgi:hypothetical protein
MITTDSASLAISQQLTSLKVQRVLNISGLVCVGLWIAAFIWFCRFIPIPDPKMTPEQVVAGFRDRTILIQIGLTLTMLALGLLVPFSSAIAAQMRRIEGPTGALATAQVCSATVLTLEFIVPVMVWQTALYRAGDGQDLRIIQMLNDMSWLIFIAPISAVCIQMYCIGACILLDSNPSPTFPRWGGYFNILAGFLITPASLCVFFKDGPLAWNGLFGVYVPLVSYCSWFPVMFYLLRRAIKSQEESARALLVSRDVVPSAVSS